MSFRPFRNAQFRGGRTLGNTRPCRRLLLDMGTIRRAGWGGLGRAQCVVESGRDGGGGGPATEDVLEADHTAQWTAVRGQDEEGGGARPPPPRASARCRPGAAATRVSTARSSVRPAPASARSTKFPPSSSIWRNLANERTHWPLPSGAAATSSPTAATPTRSMRAFGPRVATGPGRI